MVDVSFRAPADQSGFPLGSFSREAVVVGGVAHGDWIGFATIPATNPAASLQITTPSPQRTQESLTRLILPQGAYIKHVGFRVLGNVTLGAATGRLKLAGAIQDGATISVSSAAAASNALAAMPVGSEVATYNSAVSATELLGADTEFLLFATDGAAVGSEATSTVVSASGEAIRVIVRVAFEIPSRFPFNDEVGFPPPVNLDGDFEG